MVFNKSNLFRSTASPLTNLSPHSSKLKPMRTLLEEQCSREDQHLSEESENEDLDEEIDTNANQCEVLVNQTDESVKQTLRESSTHENLAELSGHTKNPSVTTPSALSSGYGSQPLTSTPASSEDSISLHSGTASYDETTASNNDVSVIEKAPNNVNGINGQNCVGNDSQDNEVSHLMSTPMSVADSVSDAESVSSYDSNASEAQLMAALPEWLTVGQSVRISPESKMGTVAYVGKTNFAQGIWVGVELEAPNGKNDGSYNGTQYFKCRPKYGIFVRPEKLKPERGRTLRSQRLAHSEGMARPVPSTDRL